MRRFSSILGISLLAVAVSGCFPLRTNYLEPSGQGGAVLPRRPACGGPPDSMYFWPPDREWIRVQLTADLPNPHRNDGHATLRLSIYKNFQLVEGPLFATDASRKDLKEKAELVLPVEAAAAELSLTSASGQRFLSIPFLQPSATASLDNHGLIAVWPLPDDASAGFEVSLPRLSIGGTRVEAPVVRFQPKAEVVTYAVNC